AAMAPLTRAAALVPSALETRVLMDDALLTADGEADEVPEPRRVAIGVSAADALDQPGLLEAWAAAFGARDDITLIVTGLRNRTDDLLAAAARCGLDRVDAADVMTLEERHPVSVEVRL